MLVCEVGTHVTCMHLITYIHVTYMSEGHQACTHPVPRTLSLYRPVAWPSLSDSSPSYSQTPLPTWSFRGGHDSPLTKTLSSCSPGQCATGRHRQTRASMSYLHTPQRQIPGTWVFTAPHPHPQRVVCPSPRLSGVPGTTGMAPTRKNHHSRRIASAADASSAVQMMIKCYCARESSKEGLISFIVRKGSTGLPAPHSRTALTQCMLGTPESHMPLDE